MNGKLHLDNGGTHAPVQREGVLRELNAGLHPVEVRYFDAGGGASLEVGIRRRGESDSHVLDGLLFHDVRQESGGG